MAYEFKPNEEGPKLTVKFLKEYGFVREVIGDEDDEKDNDVSWYKDGISIIEDQWSKDNFTFPTHFREDGRMKSGYNMETEQKLKNLFYVLNNKELTK